MDVYASSFSGRDAASATPLMGVSLFVKASHRSLYALTLSMTPSISLAATWSRMAPVFSWPTLQSCISSSDFGFTAKPDSQSRSLASSTADASGGPSAAKRR